MLGKVLRMRRVLRSGRCVIVPMDHGLFFGPIKGLEDPRAIVKTMAENGADAILVSPGFLARVEDCLGDMGVILRIDGTHTRLGSHTERVDLITTVEHALEMGVDMVVLNIYPGVDNEDELLKKLGMAATECDRRGMPLMGEMIPASILGKHYGKSDGKLVDFTEDLKIATRVGAEIGADVIKTHYTGAVESFKDLVSTAMVPVVVAGGPKMDSEEDILTMARESIEGGGAGICIGRNLWQSPDPAKLLRRLCDIAHK